MNILNILHDSEIDYIEQFKLVFILKRVAPLQYQVPKMQCKTWKQWVVMEFKAALQHCTLTRTIWTLPFHRLQRTQLHLRVGGESDFQIKSCKTYRNPSDSWRDASEESRSALLSQNKSEEKFDCSTAHKQKETHFIIPRVPKLASEEPAWEEAYKFNNYLANYLASMILVLATIFVQFVFLQHLFSIWPNTNSIC